MKPALISFHYLNPSQLTLTAPIRGMPTTHFVRVGRPRCFDVLRTSRWRGWRGADAPLYSVHVTETSFRGCLCLFVAVAEWSCWFPPQDRQAENQPFFCLTLLSFFYYTQYHCHIFLLNLSQFRASNGKEGHFDKKVLLKLSSTLKLRNFENGMKIIGSGTTSLICTAYLGFSHILWCGLLLYPVQGNARSPINRIKQ